MKKVVLFALLLATVAAASAQAAHHEPKWGVPYLCFYDNYYGNASDPGYSVWYNQVPVNSNLIRALEDLDTSYGGDTYKCSWAKPNTPGLPAYNPTTWEFTFNPSGPQCKNTTVSPNRSVIIFQDCTDGHTRTCYSVW